MTTPAQLISLAESQIGIHEDPAGSNHQKFGVWAGLDRNPWCAMFVSWVFDHAGHTLPAINFPRGYWAVASGAAWAQSHGMWSTGRAVPGDIVIFTFSHTGIVLSDDGSTVRTIEGNAGGYGGEVGIHYRSRSEIRGFWKTSRWLTSSSPQKSVAPPLVPKQPEPHYNGPFLT